MLCTDVCLVCWLRQLEGSPIVVAQNEKFDGKGFYLGFLASITWIDFGFLCVLDQGFDSVFV